MEILKVNRINFLLWGEASRQLAGGQASPAQSYFRYDSNPSCRLPGPGAANSECGAGSVARLWDMKYEPRRANQ